MGVKFVEREEFAECPCGVGTDKGIEWDYPGDNFKQFQPMCGICQDEAIKARE